MTRCTLKMYLWRTTESTLGMHLTFLVAMQLGDSSLCSSYDFSADGFSFADIQNQALPHKSAAQSATQSAPGSSARNTQDWCKKLAYRYRRIQEIYSKYGCDLESELLTQLTRDRCYIPLQVCWDRSSTQPGTSCCASWRE